MKSTRTISMSRNSRRTLYEDTWVLLVTIWHTSADNSRMQFDRRVVPIVCTLYVLSYLDRGNIGNAKTAGADDDLNINDSEWTWVLNAFYICYVLFEWVSSTNAISDNWDLTNPSIQTTVLWKIFPAHIYVAVLCLLWGVSAMSAGSVQDMSHLIVCRVFLGIFEASFGAGA